MIAVEKKDKESFTKPKFGYLKFHDLFIIYSTKQAEIFTTTFSAITNKLASEVIKS